MADRRLQLHEKLCDILGSRNVYFQPPESIQMKYPAIVYSLDDIRIARADDSAYRSTRRYSVTLIDADPDSAVIEKLAALPMCQFNRDYKTDNLNHDVFELFF